VVEVVGVCILIWNFGGDHDFGNDIAIDVPVVGQIGQVTTKSDDVAS